MGSGVIIMRSTDRQDTEGLLPQGKRVIGGMNDALTLFDIKV
jgi:hypothetical protein